MGGITKFEYSVTSPSGADTIVKEWTLVPFQGGKNQNSHPSGVRDEWKESGRPTTITRLALRGDPAAKLNPVDTYLEKRLTNGWLCHS